MLKLTAILVVLLTVASLGYSQEAADDLPGRHGLSLSYAQDYSQEATNFALVTYQHYWSAQRLVAAAPAELLTKLELSAGLKLAGEERAMVSVVPLLHYYLDGLATESVRPYLEGGVGVIYNDFLDNGAGTRWNFTPQAGFGVEVGHGEKPWFMAVRWHHISNAGLGDNNMGLDTIMLTIGKRF